MLTTLTTPQKIEAWEKVLSLGDWETHGICFVAERYFPIPISAYLLLVMNDEQKRLNNYGFIWSFDASGTASRRAFIQGKIDELRKELSSQQTKEEEK